MGRRLLHRSQLKRPIGLVGTLNSSVSSQQSFSNLSLGMESIPSLSTPSRLRSDGILQYETTGNRGQDPHGGKILFTGIIGSFMVSRHVRVCYSVQHNSCWQLYTFLCPNASHPDKRGCARYRNMKIRNNITLNSNWSSWNSNLCRSKTD